MPLVDEDILPSGEWIKGYDKGILEKSDGEIRKLDTYIPSNVHIPPGYNIEDMDHIVFVFVHGTAGEKTLGFVKDNGFIGKEFEEQNYRYFKRFAAYYSRIHKKVAHVVSFQWSGNLSFGTRVEAGKLLAEALRDRTYLTSKSMVGSCIRVASGHSHGCNVINEATNHLEIDLIIPLACPVHDYHGEERTHLPKYFKQMISFYSKDDWIAAMGRARDIHMHDMSVDIKNITKTAAGIIPAFIANPSKFIESAKMVAQALMEPNNTVPVQEGKVMVSIQCKINDRHPGHSEVADMVRYLPQVITMLHMRYPVKVAENTTFKAHAFSDERYSLFLYPKKCKSDSPKTGRMFPLTVELLHSPKNDKRIHGKGYIEDNPINLTSVDASFVEMNKPSLVNSMERRIEEGRFSAYQKKLLAERLYEIEVQNSPHITKRLNKERLAHKPLVLTANPPIQNNLNTLD